MAELEGQIAVVTGAAQGMGRAIARELLDRGAGVALCDIQGDTAGGTGPGPGPARPRAGSTGPGSTWPTRPPCGPSSRDVEERFGRIDILVNNAGIHPLHPIEAITDEEWDRVLAVNLKAQFILCQAVLPAMRRRKYGRIINISSEAGKNGGTVAALHYCASKGAILAFTRNLAQQVGADGITVNAICPGRIATEMSAAVSPEENQKFIDKSIIKRLGAPEDIAFAVAYLASPRAGFVTAETMAVNGGTLRD